MRVAIVHYHLSPGGVTSVIRAASHSLEDAAIPHVILCGSCSPTEDLPACVITELGYRKSSERSAAAVLADMRSACMEALGGPPDVWHFHNHSLGKNILMPEIVALLAGTGERLVLQLHDLAEDGRPQNYPLIADQPHLYPLSPRVIYGFINRRDRDHFIQAGLPEENAAYLPNPVPATESSRSTKQQPLVLYPSRAIRRKNIGEILLLSILSPAGTRFAITRAPEDPSALAIHEEWRAFSEKHRLPVDFNVVDRMAPDLESDPSYESWIKAATHFVTTSVSEGFGMIFGEAIACGKPLIGRDLPTHPFSGQQDLYQRISIPSGWVDPEMLRIHLTAAQTEAHRLYRKTLPGNVIGQTLEALYEDDHLDFGNLPEAIQKQLLLRLLEDPSSEFFIGGESARTWLARVLAHREPHSSSVKALPPHPETILRLYEYLMARPLAPAAWLPPDRILGSYLAPENFHFLLTSPPRIRAVIFDIYGTLVIAPPGAVKPDPTFDPSLNSILESFGHPAVGDSPTSTLHQTVTRHHAGSAGGHPEVDLREIWREILGTHVDTTPLVQAIEDAWHPCQPMPGAPEILRLLAARGILLGILSNAQVNTLPTLDKTVGPVSPLFHPELSILSYQHRMAKPSPDLFRLLAGRLAAIGIAPSETLFVGNDPLQDILPAAAVGFRTALFTGHPGSLRPGDCSPDLTLQSLSEISAATSSF